MSEKEQFYKLHGASLEMFAKTRSLVNCFLDDQTQLFSHSETLGSSSHLLFPGNDFLHFSRNKATVGTRSSVVV